MLHSLDKDQTLFLIFDQFWIEEKDIQCCVATKYAFSSLLMIGYKVQGLPCFST